MIKAAAQYRRALKKELRCSSSASKRLMGGFNRTLSAYLEEHLSPTADDLIAAFGTPREMADVLMADLTTRELALYQKNLLFRKILLSVLIVLLFTLTTYIWFFKTTGLTTIDEANYISVTEEKSSQVKEEGAYSASTEGDSEHG